MDVENLIRGRHIKENRSRRRFSFSRSSASTLGGWNLLKLRLLLEHGDPTIFLSLLIDLCTS